MEEMGNQVVQAAQGNGVDMAAIIAAIITGLITFIIGLLVNRQGRTQFFSSIVSKERMVWIKEMRDLCTELCTICDLNKSEENLSDEELVTFYNAKNGMLLHLNSIQRKEQAEEFPVDKELFELLNNKSFSQIQGSISDIREKATLIFKTEWDKVKIEAGNSRATVKKIEKIQRGISLPLNN